MGNSTVSVQSVIDFANTIGDISPVLKGTGGSSREPARTIANDVMSELIAERFNWKWNRKAIAPFPTNSWQQDYPQINVTDIGWLEKWSRTDINNTSMPKPTFQGEAVRDLDITGQQFGWPAQMSWLTNDLMEHAQWPGPAVTFTQPIGASTTPANPFTNIVDAVGNIMILTTYGVTGQYPAIAPKNSPPGFTVQDGSVVWTVCNPNGMGLRIYPKPPQAGNTWLLRPFYQAEPPTIVKLTDFINPIPDSYSSTFRDGFICFCHKYCSDPKVKARFPMLYELWEKAVLNAAKQGDREQEGKGFFPDRGIMGMGGGSVPIGPAWPYSNWSIG